MDWIKHYIAESLLIVFKDSQGKSKEYIVLKCVHYSKSVSDS